MFSLIFVALAALPDSAPRVRPQDDRTAIMATLQRLTDGMRTRDTALLRSAFQPGAKLVGMRPRPDGSIVLQTLSELEFAQFVARDHCGVDAFQLLKLPDGWRIVSLADTFQREGCPRNQQMVSDRVHLNQTLGAGDSVLVVQALTGG